MFDVEFSHFGYGFRCVAEDWGDESGAFASCNFLKAAVRELNNTEIADLHNALLRSDEAFADDPIWKSPALPKLFQMRDAAREAGLQQVTECRYEEGACSCRLIPTFAS
jgi:hypothetical protein